MVQEIDVLMARSIKNNRQFPWRTICEIHREIFRELKKLGFNGNSKVIKLLLEAYPIGKKMNNKLRQYKHGYDAGWYEENKLEGPEIDE